MLLLSANKWTAINGNGELMRARYMFSVLGSSVFSGWQNKRKAENIFVCHHLKMWMVRTAVQTPTPETPWEVFPLIQCNNLLTISEGQFHALFPRLLGQPQRNSPLQRLCRMMTMNALKCFKGGSEPQALLPITHAEIQSYVLNTNPNDVCIISNIWSWLGPAAKRNRDLLFYWISQPKHRKKILLADLKVCACVCVCVFF